VWETSFSAVARLLLLSHDFVIVCGKLQSNSLLDQQHLQDSMKKVTYFTGLDIIYEDEETRIEAMSQRRRELILAWATRFCYVGCLFLGAFVVGALVKIDSPSSIEDEINISHVRGISVPTSRIGDSTSSPSGLSIPFPRLPSSAPSQIDVYFPLRRTSSPSTLPSFTPSNAPSTIPSFTPSNAPSTLSPTIEPQTTQLQYFSLEIFYKETSSEDYSWPNNENWLERDVSFCDWYGIDCSPNGDYIEVIAIPGNSIESSDAYQLFGILSQGITRMRQLDLSDNQLKGSINESVFHVWTNLELLNLSGNQITGTIPSEIGTLSSLTTLDLSNTNVTGTLPEEICSIENISITLPCAVACSCCNQCIG